MAIEFGSFVGNINNGIYSIPFLNTIFSSVLYTSIILTILLIIILLVIQPEDNSSELIKIFLYTFITNVIIFSVHSSIVSNKYKEHYSDKKSYDFISGINDKTGGAIYADETIKVIPQIKNDADSDSDSDSDKNYEEPKVKSISDMLDDVEKKL